MVYLVLDGPDGGGKSTQARLLRARLEAEGRRVRHVREPGSTPVGEALRRLLLAPETGDLDPVTEALLFTAARRELVRREIGPALAAGEEVLAERCFVSTLAYQCLALTDGVDYEWVLDLSRRAHADAMPDAVLVLDVDASTSAGRRSSRSADRFEARDDGFHQRVRTAYLEVARRESYVHVVDASAGVQVVQAVLWQRLAELLA